MPTSPSDNRDLKSWKEIAEYLGVTVRTAQRYEQELGLPVRRLPGGRGRIWTSTAEIDAWVQSRLQRSNGDSQNSPVHPAPALPRRIVCRNPRLWWAVAAAAIIFAVLTWVFWPSPVPVHARIDKNTLIISDAKGKELWSYESPDKLFDIPNFSENNTNQIWFGDLYGDGTTVVVYDRFFTTDGSDYVSELMCFSSRGKEKWTYRPGREVSAPKNQNMSGNFHIVTMAIAKLDPKFPNCILIVSLHETHFPTQVALLSPDGTLIRDYWHSGYLKGAFGYAVLGSPLIADINGDGRIEIVLGGNNNGSKCATVVILDPQTMGGASVEEDPEFQLADFDPGREVARLMFRRSCLSQASEPYNNVERIRTFSGRLQVDTREYFDASRPALGLGTLNYTFDSSFRVIELTAADNFRRTHVEFRSMGKIDHDFRDAELIPLRDVRVLRPKP